MSERSHHSCTSRQVQYPQPVTRELQQFQMTIELMELGDLSSLAESPDQCKAYHRDRNEPWGMVEPRDTDVSELGTLANDYGVDYVYIYNENFEWECSRPDYLSGTLTPLEILSEITLN